MNIPFRYKQVYDYNFEKQRGENGKPYTAFVQVVWKETKWIGAGRAVGNVNGQMFSFYCVRYKPSGLYGDLKTFKENVNRGIFIGFLGLPGKIPKQEYSLGMEGKSLVFSNFFLISCGIRKDHKENCLRLLT